MAHAKGTQPHLGATEARTVGKRVVRILLECFLVLFVINHYLISLGGMTHNVFQLFVAVSVRVLLLEFVTRNFPQQQPFLWLEIPFNFFLTS